jgi:predicted dehydrogenase
LVEHPLRIGILGAARVAEYAMIAPARSEPRANLFAIAARDPARARVYAVRHAIARVHGTYEELMSDAEIDLVYVATPPSLHAKLALASIAAGKHVLVEKPFSMNAAEAEAVARAARAAGVFVAEAMHSRHHRLFARVVEIVRSGALGKIERLSGHFDAPIARGTEEFRWQRELGGGALMDLGVYPLSWLRGVVGSEPTVVRASARSECGVDAGIEAELEFPSGEVGHVRASMAAQTFAASLVVECDRGTLTVLNPLAPQMGHSLVLAREGTRQTETLAGPSSFAAQLTAVCVTIQDKVPFLLPDRDYVQSMVLIDAVREATGSDANSGR